MTRRTKKYVKAQQAVYQLSSGKKAIVPAKASHEDIYTALDKAGYWWDSKSGEWKKREEGQSGTDGRYRLAPGVYRVRITAHEADIVELCRSEAQHHQVIDMSDPYHNDRDGKHEIVRVYFTCLKR